MKYKWMIALAYLLLDGYNKIIFLLPLTSHPKLIIFITVLYNTVINETEASVTKPIEGVSERILSCAMEEFLEKGYSDASLRTIAAKAGTTTGSIYSRFKDKEGLFAAIVGPVAEYMMNLFVKTQEEFHAVEPERQPKEMDDYVISGMDEMLDYIYDNFTAFQLLLEASYGTKFQNFVEQLAEVEAEYTYKFMEVIHFQNEDGNEVTEEFVHIMTRALFDSMFEVVRHKMEKETARNYVHMLEKFNYAGWNTILKFEE